MKKITIDDIAEAVGVSKTTVSRALSGKGRISDATKKRVIQYAEDHKYKPNVMAKGLAQKCTYNLAVVIPQEDLLIQVTLCCCIDEGLPGEQVS